jgi:hypothetical protein
LKIVEIQGGAGLEARADCLHGGKVEAFLIAYGTQERANSATEFRNGALGGLSQEGFEFAEHLLDRVEIR